MNILIHNKYLVVGKEPHQKLEAMKWRQLKINEVWWFFMNTDIICIALSQIIKKTQYQWTLTAFF